MRVDDFHGVSFSPIALMSFYAVFAAHDIDGYAPARDAVAKNQPKLWGLFRTPPIRLTAMRIGEWGRATLADRDKKTSAKRMGRLPTITPDTRPDSFISVSSPYYSSLMPCRPEQKKNNV
jgi:hypothetical protein